MAPPKRPMPDDFPARAPHMTTSQCRAAWGAGDSTTARWAREAGIHIGNEVESAPIVRVSDAIPESFVANAMRPNAALTAEFGWKPWHIAAWRKRLGITLSASASHAIRIHDGTAPRATRWRQSARREIAALPTTHTPAPDATEIGRAKRFLMGKFSRVFSAEILPEAERASLPDHGKGLVIVGNLRVPRREIVAFAVERGMPA